MGERTFPIERLYSRIMLGFAMRGNMVIRMRCIAARRRHNRLAQLVTSLCIGALLLMATPGCAPSGFVNVRKAPQSPLSERLQLTSREGPQASARTTQFLRRYDLAERAAQDPASALPRLARVIEREPSAEGYYAFAELAYLAAKRQEGSDEAAALDSYAASVAHSYLYLFDPTVAFSRNPYDPQFRGACDLYNAALEGALRIAAARGGLLPGNHYDVEAGGQTWQVDVVSRGSRWRDSDFAQFQFVSDFELTGLTNHYRTYGLGVPLIGVRRSEENRGPLESYYPPNLSWPVTAFLRVVPDAIDPATGFTTGHRCLIELYDPLDETDISVVGRKVPLESDLSTPIAYSLDQPELLALPVLGLLRPDQAESLRGLYMAQPYEPDKIPVLMIHGLASSPITWMEMYNDLQASPELRSHYQFWFYFYPSGQPFWRSAQELREDLARLRGEVDPAFGQQALDQMVLIGHSMGGLVSKLQTLRSGQDYWRLVSDRPFSELVAEPDERERLAELFFFEPNRSVQRVITIGTPHRGSRFANDATRWLGRRLITLPQQLIVGQEDVIRNNRDLFRSRSLLDVTTSIDSLSPDSPILPVMLASPRAPWVQYHNIVGVLEEDNWLTSWTDEGDGVVEYASAHLDDVASEIIIDADHTGVHRHPLAILEVRRVLLDHLGRRAAASLPTRSAARTALGGRAVAASGRSTLIDETFLSGFASIPRRWHSFLPASARRNSIAVTRDRGGKIVQFGRALY